MQMLLRLAVLAALTLSSVQVQAKEKESFTSDFPDDECHFRSHGGNPLFPLKPGLQRFYDNNACVAKGECDEQESLQITVTNQTKNISIKDDGKWRVIPTRIIEEREWNNGRLVEVSRNFYAACGAGAMRDVYYFGENVDVYEYLPSGKVRITHPGQWLAGVNGAEPGIIMPGGAFLLGSRYYQELAPKVALDRAEHVATDLDFETEAGEFDECVKVVETSPLEPGHESVKIYCPKVGLAADNELLLKMVIDPGT